MRIGIDIDGCIEDVARFMIDYGTKFCIENNIEYKIKDDEYDDAEFLGISLDEVEKFWNKNLVYYITEYRVRDYASEVIKKLKVDNDIYIVTARNEYGLPQETQGKMQELTKEWLRKNDIVYDKIIFTQESKLPYVLDNKIDILIEDSPKNILEVSTKVPVLCFDNLYNKAINGDNIKRVYSWYDILNKIKQLNK